MQGWVPYTFVQKSLLVCSLVIDKCLGDAKGNHGNQLKHRSVHQMVIQLMGIVHQFDPPPHKTLLNKELGKTFDVME